ncbi:MAG: extracellular solute-binding protein [Synechococcaceae cyanobacterium SM2_3_60]|nr:extracellular solute-binding protein [Synechococcaceae cyanobacterium SM2_3_60]
MLRRRTFLKGAAAAVAAGPIIINRTVQAQDSVLNLYTWSDYVYPEMIQSFEAETGIKVNLSTYGSNDEVLNRLRAARGSGFDIVQPSITYTGAWVEQELLQPLDESKSTSTVLSPRCLKARLVSVVCKEVIASRFLLTGVQKLCVLILKPSPPTMANSVLAAFGKTTIVAK